MTRPNPPDPIATETKFKQTWVNAHGNHMRRDVPFIQIRANASGYGPNRALQESSQRLQSVVKRCIEANTPIRIDGSRWALSDIAVPKGNAIQLPDFDGIFVIPQELLSESYRLSCSSRGVTPIYVTGTVKIGRINRSLALKRLALPTSGASDGQTLAGATACGTHGGAQYFGALHDAVSAVHTLVSGDEARFVSPSNPCFDPKITDFLAKNVGIPTIDLQHDEIFQACRVHLGSMGIILGMVIEAVPLYALEAVTTSITYSSKRELGGNSFEGDEIWRHALRTGEAEIANSNALQHAHKAAPHHFELVLNPFTLPSDRTHLGWIISMQKVPMKDRNDVQVHVRGGSPPHPDLVSVIADIQMLIAGKRLRKRYRELVDKQLEKRYAKLSSGPKVALPGVMFGPTALPEGASESLEFAVPKQHAVEAVEIIRDVIQRSHRKGRNFGGALGIRLVGGSQATLAMNQREEGTCFIELPCIRSSAAIRVFHDCTAALRNSGIKWCCHWGQSHTMTRKDIEYYWGKDAVDGWIRARRQLFGDDRIANLFASPTVKKLLSDG